jgi:four helix bundle protein
MQQSANSTKIRTYKDLIVWQKADQLAHAVYDVTIEFPKTEMFGFTSQLRRAALSVPTNIVEGFSRMNKNEFRHFLSISFGSLAEVQYLIEFATKQHLITVEKQTELISLKEDCSKLLWRLHASQKK